MHSEPVTVDGHQGVLYAAFERDRGPWGVVWTDDDGLTMQVVGFAPRDEVVRLASRLEDVSPAAWRTAKAEARGCDGPS